MTIRACAPALLTLLALWMTGGTARAACQLVKVGELPVTIKGLRAFAAVKVNGTDEAFMIDSGSSFSSVSAHVVSELRLPLQPPPANLTLTGIGGDVAYRVTTVEEFTILGVSVHNLRFTSGLNDSDDAGVIGQDILQALGDVEYDLAGGAVRFWRHRGCSREALAYWVKEGQTYSVIDIDRATGLGVARVNGVEMRVHFDTGAPQTAVSLQAAARAGVVPGSPGVQSAGLSYGAGPRVLATSVAPFASVKIGGEEISNTRLLVSDLGWDSDVGLGADFFLSHRIFVVTSQGKLYFTYNGGPVFDFTHQSRLEETSAATATDTPGAPASAALPQESVQTGAQAAPAEPTDAAGFRRRAAILRVHHDYEHAIADLTRAIELDPAQPQLFQERAAAYRDNRQLQRARADLDHVLTLAPSDVSARLESAELHLQARQQRAAIADIDAASRSAPGEDYSHLYIGQLYQRAGRPEPAIAEYGLWLASHDGDSHQGEALLSRCSARAEQGEDLDKALSDCSAALRRIPEGRNETALQLRGLVRLRRGELERSISDYSAALGQAPRDARALYGRGLARLRQGVTAEGQADLAAARAQRPKIDAEFEKMGLTP
jgi:tetratricopeptide (TPR) repeat protein/predicted aspartyl protease